MGDAVSSIANAYLTAVGGIALDHQRQVGIGYQANGSYSPYFTTVFNPDLPPAPNGTKSDPNYVYAGYATAEQAVNEATLALLQNTEVIGGNLLLKRAHAHSQYSNSMTLAGDLQVAQDYERYLNNREAINALIAANPNSVFAAGWAATFAQINDLGLNHYGAVDFLGGLPGYLDSVHKAGLNTNAGNISVRHGDNGSIVIDIRVPNGVDIPGSLSVFASQTTETHDATGTTLHLTFTDGLAAGGFHAPASASLVSSDWLVFGGAGNNIWFGRDDLANEYYDSQTTASHDILIGGALGDNIQAGNGWDYVDGGAGNDVIFGEAGNDVLRGGDGNDTLYGGDGDDQLAGDRGADVLHGGAGNDSYAFARGDGADTVLDDSGSADSLVFGPGITASDILIQVSGNDLIVGVRDPANPNATFAQLTDRITLQSWMNPLDRIETFRFADGTSWNVAGLIFGTTGNDLLVGGSGADLFAGGAGDDTYIVNSPGDVVFENPGEGTDTVQSSISFALGYNLENLTLTGSSSINGTGNAANNVIIGNGGNNVLSGLDGADTFYGGGGSDTFDGGAGTDTAVFSGNRANYAVTWIAATQRFEVVDLRSGSPDGVDSLTGVEIFQFAISRRNTMRRVG
jgi:Ca2+-binding RTX toxin-like protein